MLDDVTPRNIRPSLGASASRFTPISTFPEPARTVVQGAFDRAKKSLAEEFTGITAGGTTRRTIIPIRAPTTVAGCRDGRTLFGAAIGAAGTRFIADDNVK